MWQGLIELLDEHEPADAAEALSLAEMRAAAEAGPALLDRSSLGAHFTASCFCLDETGTQALLLRHKDFGRLVQPGGHIEPGDSSCSGAAMRELSEEALPPGSASATLLLDGSLFDVDAHPIAAGPKAPAHRHFDLRFLVRLPRGYQPWHAPSEAAESLLADLAWLGAQGSQASDPSVARMARKALALRLGAGAPLFGKPGAP